MPHEVAVPAGRAGRGKPRAGRGRGRGVGANPRQAPGMLCFAFSCEQPVKANSKWCRDHDKVAVKAKKQAEPLNYFNELRMHACE